MPYTRIWDEAAPLGGADPRLIDNFFRDLKVDLRERINSVIGVAIGTAFVDPLIGAGLDLTALKAASDAGGVIIGSQTLRQITIPWSAGNRKAETGTIDITRQRYRVTGTTGVGGLFIPVEGLKIGNIITKVSLLVFVNSSNHTLTMNFYEMLGAADATTVNVAQPANSGTVQWVDSGAVAITVAADDRYAFEVDLNNNNLDTGTELAIYGVRVVYTSGSADQR